MKTMEPATERNLDGYGAPPIPWAAVRERLDRGLTQEPGAGGPDRHTSWLATAGPDGRPHVRPVGILWVDGCLYFNTGASTRKGRNLMREPRCAITFGTSEFDLVVEGSAVRVTGDRLHLIAAEYRSRGWSPTVADDSLYAEFSAPSSGPPPWDVYELAPRKVYAFAPSGAMRWTFDGGRDA